MIRLLLVDDKEGVRLGWRMRLALEPDVQVVGEAANGRLALQLTAEAHPDVVLLDLRLGYGEDGVQLIQPLRQCLPDVHIVIVTVYDSVLNRERALQLGADAFVSKQRPFEELLLAIRQQKNRKR